MSAACASGAASVRAARESWPVCEKCTSKTRFIILVSPRAGEYRGLAHFSLCNFFKRCFGAFVAAPRDDLVGTDEHKVRTVEVAGLFVSQLKNVDVGEAQGVDLLERDQRPFETEQVVQRAAVGHPQVRRAGGRGGGPGRQGGR